MQVQGDLLVTCFPKGSLKNKTPSFWVDVFPVSKRILANQDKLGAIRCGESTQKSLGGFGFLVLSTRGHAPKTSAPKGLCHVTTVWTGAATCRHKMLFHVARCPRLVGGQNKSALNHKVLALQLNKKCACFLHCGGCLHTGPVCHIYAQPG